MQDASTAGSGIETFKALRKVAFKNRGNTQAVCTRYALERLISRIFASKYSDDFVLKGGLIMMYAEDTDPLTSRATEDIDVHLPTFEGTIDDFKAVMLEILGDAADDGIAFDTDTMKVARTREGAVPGGSLTVHAAIGDMKIKLKCDVGFDRRPALDVSVMDEMPSILPDRFPPVKIRRIPLSWTVADKLQTLHRHGDSTTRLKDFYDLYVILTRNRADPAQTVEALGLTYDLFEMDVPEGCGEIDALSDDFAAKHAPDWDNECKIRRFAVETPDFATVVRTIREHLDPMLEQAHANKRVPVAA